MLSDVETRTLRVCHITPDMLSQHVLLSLTTAWTQFTDPQKTLRLTTECRPIPLYLFSASSGASCDLVLGGIL